MVVGDGRNGDGYPGAADLWRGLLRLAYFTEPSGIVHPVLPAGLCPGLRVGASLGRGPR